MGCLTSLVSCDECSIGNFLAKKALAVRLSLVHTLLMALLCVVSAQRMPAQAKPASALPLPVSKIVRPTDPAGVEFFEKKIRPVLIQNCYECHSHVTRQS